MISSILERSVIDFSARNGFGFGFSALVYIIVPVYFFILAFILSLVLLHVNSFPVTLAVSLLISLPASWKTFNSAVEIYNRPDYFDKTYFYSDVFQICSAFIIFSLVGILVWLLKSRFINSAQIQ
ncbi:MAG: hypothetical protein H0U50_03555 [Pyrinomonadaceae bacterium]|nr:hypothetical protein [Pyrinomonadaceae bacterium]